MPNIQGITRERHANQRWNRYADYKFTSADALCVLAAQELPKAMLHLPIAFIEINGAYMPVAVLGLVPGKNLFVALDGRWVSSYVPMVYRSYPFVMVSAEDGKQILCIDEDSGLLSQTGGEPFFGEDGQPSKTLSEVLAFLNQLGANHLVTQRICSLLQKYELIQPWLIKLQEEEGELAVEGLFRIDEPKLNQLPAEAFMELRDSGALLLAYCQLLSMQHLHLLGQLAGAHAQAAAQFSPFGEDLDLSFMADGDFDFSLSENEIIKFT